MVGGPDLPAGGLGAAPGLDLGFSLLMFIMEMTQVPDPCPMHMAARPACSCLLLPRPSSLTVGGGREEGLRCSQGSLTYSQHP